MPRSTISMLFRGVLCVAVLLSVGTVGASKEKEKRSNVSGFTGTIVKLPDPNKMKRDSTVTPSSTAPAAPAFAGVTVVEFRFDKQVLVESGGCLTREKVNFGNTLKCHIALPPNVPGGIVQLQFACDPARGAPCQHTLECPGGGICLPLHTGPTVPLNLPINKPRELDWYGWTDDGNHAALIFHALVQ